LATFVLGISFGVLARSLEWGTVAPIVFSMISFSGSAQFAVAAVLGDGGGAFAATIAAVLPVPQARKAHLRCYVQVANVLAEICG
jgi:predicted branched-subunit amino acid permease